MAACQEIRGWFTETVLVPVQQFITEAKEKCEEVGQWVEENVEQPVERWISRQEERCREMAWWNPIRWLCELVTVVVKVIEWVIVTVVKWVVTIVCRIVVTVIGIVVKLVLRVIAWAVTFLVCLFTDPLEALKSFRDLWTIILDAVEEIIDLASDLLGDVLGILDDLNQLLDSVSSSLGWVGVVIGPVKGVKDLVRNLIEDIRDLLGALKDIILGILGLNWCRILRGFTDLGTGIVRVIADSGGAAIAVFFGPAGLAVAGWLISIRVIGGAVAGTRDNINLLQLEDIIRNAIDGAFGAGSDRAKNAIDKVGIGAGTMGLPFRADARRLFIASRSRSLNARDLHQAGVIDLYALAGYLSSCKDDINQPDGEVVYTGTDLRVSYADLEDYLDGITVPSFQVFAITRDKFRWHLKTARRKSKYIGVRLTWGSIGELEAVSDQEVPLNSRDEVPPGDAVQEAMLGRMGRVGGGNDNLAILPSISHFHYVLRSNGTELFGLASWFRPNLRDEGPSGVTYRNRTPDWVFRWVLAHEMGHYWGIDHSARGGGSRSLDEIMWSPASGGPVSAQMVFEFLLGGGEPRFTSDDARDAWDWITGPGANSLLP